MDKKVKTLVFTSVLAALVVILQLIGGIPIGPFSITLTLIPIVVGAITLGPVPGLILGLVFGVVVSILSLTGKDPGGQMVFAANPFVAWAMCLLKGAMAGLLPALVFKLEKKNKYSAELTCGIMGVFLFLSGFAVANYLNGSNDGAPAKTGVKVVVTIIFAVVAAGLLIGLYRMLKTNNSAYYISSIVAPIANTGIFVVGMLLFFKPLLQSWAGGSNVMVYVITGLCGINFLIEFLVAVVLSPAVAAIDKYASRRL